MDYVIIDLEWNNTYFYKLKKNSNEIIEIGAVRLSSDFEILDEFRSFISTKVGKKVRGFVKDLTNISEKDLKTGMEFNAVMHDFRKWLAGKPTVIMTWGKTDIRVLIDNYKYFSGTSSVPFLKYYINLQDYVQSKLGLDNSTQLGLSQAVELLNIDIGDMLIHRALADCILEARCLQNVGDPKGLAENIVPCDDIFYGSFYFKPYYITNRTSPDIDEDFFQSTCPVCGFQMLSPDKLHIWNQAFSGKCLCPNCSKLFTLTVWVKRKYNSVEVRQRLCEIENTGKHFEKGGDTSMDAIISR